MSAPNSYRTDPPKSIEEAVEIIEILRGEMARICVACGRSKNGTGMDVDWFELHKDVEDLALSDGPKEKVLAACLRKILPMHVLAAQALPGVHGEPHRMAVKEITTALAACRTDATRQST